MQSVLIDTDIAIDFLRGVEPIKDFVISLWKDNRAYISLLSVYELYAGMRHGEENSTNAFIGACSIEQLNLEMTIKASEKYRHQRKQGQTLTAIDCLIWATAKVNHHKIATRNVRHYPDKEILVKNKYFDKIKVT